MSFDQIENVGGGRKYTKPQTEILPLTNEAFEYLTNKRGLRKDTLEAYRLGCNGRGEIVIPFYDETGELLLVKFRHPRGELLRWRKKSPDDEWEEMQGKSRIEKGGKGILFGSHLCDRDAGALVICYGDYDAMAVSQDGVPNCVGLPFGDGGFEFIDHQWEFLNRFDEIIIYNDDDKFDTPEAALRAQKKLDELVVRLGKYKCRIVHKADRHGTKDANELLLLKGAGANKFAIENAEWFPAGIVAVADYEETPVQPGIPTGLSNIDKATGGLAGGQLVIISGDNGAGKTTEALNITANFIEKGAPVFWWSGEQGVKKIRYWFERIVAGRMNLFRYVEPETEYEMFFPMNEFKSVIKNWYRNFLFQYVKVGIEPEEFFKTAEIGIRRYGCRMIVIDNLMAFTGGEGEGYYQSQGDFAQNCKRFAEDWNVPVILICHNKKEDQNPLKMKLPNKDSIEGSKKITNWADLVFQMYRVPDDFKNVCDDADNLLILCKNRETGNFEAVKLAYCPDSLRLCQLSEKDRLGRSFGWEAAVAQLS